MTNENQQVTRLMRAMRSALRKDHGIEVPHAALRASYLKAAGEHPHAFGKSAKATADNEAVRPLAGQTDWPVHTLHLVEDEAGCMEWLALDAEGSYHLPFMFEFPPSAQLVAQDARIPRIDRYGIPDYLDAPELFYRSRFRLSTAKDYSRQMVDTGDDSGDTCEVSIRLPEREWTNLVLAVVDDNPGLWDIIAEWAGQHYGVNLQAASKAVQAEWSLRYIQQASIEQDEDQEKPVTLAWVYPDEDGGSVKASVNLATGVARALEELPADLRASGVRVRIESEELPDDDLTVRPVYGKDLSLWQIDDDDLEELRAALG